MKTVEEIAKIRKGKKEELDLRVNKEQDVLPQNRRKY